MDLIGGSRNKKAKIGFGGDLLERKQKKIDINSFN